MFYLDAFQSWRKTPGITGKKTNWDKGTVPRNASKLQGHQKMCSRSQTQQHRALCCWVSHTYPAPLHCLHMLGMSGIPSPESPLDNPPLQTTQTATASSKPAQDLHARYQSFSANYPCEYPSWARFQTWTKSKFCPESAVTINPPAAGLSAGWLRQRRWKASLAELWLTALTSAKTVLTQTPQHQKEQVILLTTPNKR